MAREADGHDLTASALRDPQDVQASKCVNASYKFASCAV